MFQVRLLILAISALLVTLGHAQTRRFWAVGDSKTYGYNDTTPPANGANGWPYQITVQSPGSVEYPSRYGTSGITTATMAANIDSVLASKSTTPDVVLYAMGANDGTPDSTWDTNTAYIWDAIHAKWPTAIIYVERLYNAYKTSEQLQVYADHQDALIAAGRSVWVKPGIDERAVLEGSDNYASEVPDGTHPSHLGHQLLGAAWIALLDWDVPYADSYIAASSAGDDTGTSCANARAYSFFNTSGNWGTTQIGPGTTVHLCGTITGTAGQAGLTFQGSGTAGNPVTLRFESGAVMTAPYWGGATTGAINCTSRTYVVVDGGTNGIIQNTANGTNLANQHASYGIYSDHCTYLTITNLTIQHLYENGGSSPAATDTVGQNTAGVKTVGNATGTSIHHNTLNNSRAAVWIDFDSGHDASNVTIHDNIMVDHGWHISLGADSADSEAANVSIYANDLSDWLNWQYPSATYHTDGVILFNNGSGAAVGSYAIYNNYFLGSLGAGSPTGYIACGQRTSCTIFNNVMVDDGSNSVAGYLWLYPYGGPYYVYNNTLIASSTAAYRFGVTIEAGTAGQTTVRNNIFLNVTRGLHSYGTLTNDIAASDNNIFRSSTGGTVAMATNDSGTVAWTSWRASGFDTHSTNGDAKLSSGYVPQIGSSAIGAAENLVTLGIGALNADKAGMVRATSGNWDIGAYQYVPDYSLRITGGSHSGGRH